MKFQTENLFIYSNNLWNQIILCWIVFFICVWLFARRIIILLVVIFFILCYFFYYCYQSNNIFGELQNIPVLFLFAIWFVCLFILLTFLEKNQELENTNEQPLTSSIWSELAYRFRLFYQNPKYFYIIIGIWLGIGLILLLCILLSEQNTIETTLLFDVPGWMFGIGIWWILFLFMNLLPGVPWKREFIFVVILIGMGFFGIWSSKFINITKQIQPIIQPIIQPMPFYLVFFILLWILLFVFIYKKNDLQIKQKKES